MDRRQRIAPYLLVVFFLSFLSSILNIVIVPRVSPNNKNDNDNAKKTTKIKKNIHTSTKTSPTNKKQQQRSSSSSFSKKSVEFQKSKTVVTADAPPAVSTTNTATAPSSSSSSSSSSISTEKGWWTKYVPNASRVYTPWNGTQQYGWCISSQVVPIPLYSDPPKPKVPISGLIYVKSHKASSSTSQGITAHIAHHIGRQMFPLITKNSTTSSSSSSSPSSKEVVPCTYYSHHEFARDKGHGRVRQHDTSLLWTVVRHPAARDISHVMHFEVGRNGMEPTEENIVTHLMGNDCQGRQTKYLLPSKILQDKIKPELFKTQRSQVATIIEKHIMYHYDFIGITERMDESLAVMTLLWNLDPTDVIVLAAKKAGGYDDAGTVKNIGNGKKEHQCTKIPKANKTKSLLEFVQSRPYQSSHADFLLYHAAVESLDKTIDSLGRTVVQDRTNHIRALREYAELKCSDIAKFPCSSTGQVQKHLAKDSCYIIDAGCGYKCVDRVLLPNRTMPFPR